MTRALEVQELDRLGRQDPTVKSMISAVCASENVTLGELAVDKPEVFDMLYEECFDLQNQVGTDDGRSGL